MNETNSKNYSDKIIELNNVKLSSESTDPEERKVLKSKPKQKEKNARFTRNFQKNK